MDVNDLIEGEYINVEMIEKATKKTGLILNSGEMEKNTFGENDGREERFTLNLDFNGKLKKYRPNKDSLVNLAEAYGNDTNNWAEKMITFSIGSVAGQKRIFAHGTSDDQQKGEVKEV